MRTHLTAPAKLTLQLRITGVRADGYHEVDAEMITIDLADALEVDEDGELGVLEAVDAATGRPIDVGPSEDNLVVRALRLAGRRASVVVHKRIAPGAGLGGGSADAAAILRWAGVSDGAIGSSLGADVPFCMVGGRARVRGIGEIVEPLPFVAQTLTLLTPPFGCGTPAVYAAWDDLGGPTSAGPNDLEPAALRVEPRLAEFRDRLGDATGEVPILAGSGSTWFVRGSFPGGDRVVAEATPGV